MGEQLDSVNTLTLESLNLNDIIRINDRENRLLSLMLTFRMEISVTTT